MQASAKEYAQAWYQALKETKQGDWARISENMLRRLQREGRLSELSQILDLVETAVDEENGVSAVTATVARKTDEKQLGEMAKKLLKVKNVRLEVKEDEALLGGVRFETKNRLWDLSVRRRLEHLRSALDY